MASFIRPRPRSDLTQCLSLALRTSPVMSRLYDPDHKLADATALQLVEFLEGRGIVVAAPGAPTYPRKAATANASQPKINSEPPTGATMPSPGPPNSGT